MIIARSFDMNMMIRSSSLAGLACDLVGGGGRWRPGATGTECRCPGPAAGLPMALQWTPLYVYFFLLFVPCTAWCIARVAHGLRTFSASLSASHYSEHGAPARRCGAATRLPAGKTRTDQSVTATNKQIRLQMRGTNEHDTMIME